MDRRQLERKLNEWLQRIEPINEEAKKQAIAYIDNLTKPMGSLGRLEAVGAELAGITGERKPQVSPAAILVMAADHGIAAEGVSAYPQEVTAQMVANFMRGGAAINVFARQIDAEVTVVDMGVATDIERLVDPERMLQSLAGGAGFRSRKIRPGTGNMQREPAMTREEALQAVLTGAELAEEAVRAGARCLIPGEMGIGNTTSSSAITAVMSGASIQHVVGPGTGIAGERLRQKQQIIQEAIHLHNPDRRDPLDVLSKVGGLEIAGMVGVMLGAAANRIPVLLDGFICGAAALLARGLCDCAAQYMIAGHLSHEPGHRIVLEALGKQPLLQLELRLGEGSGAALAYPLVEAAAHMIGEMATFESAGVSGK